MMFILKRTSVEVTKIGVLLVVILLLPPSNGWSSYQQRIPNGDHIPNPCNRSTIWPGVGHMESTGGVPRNPFGTAFLRNGYTWNQTLCMQDSDGDGRKNGEELGDPNCVWTPGTTPTYTDSSNLTHPGICEPVESRNCRAINYRLERCGPRPYDCPAIDDSAVFGSVLRFSGTPVPNVESTYMCRVFPFTMYLATDIVAFEPVVVNAEFVNHMSLFGCTEEPDQPVLEPLECSKEANTPCRNLIGFWTVGVDGVCLNSQMGYRIGGSNDFKYVILQVHWNNPLLKQNLTISSGMKLYQTANLRPNLGGILTVGQNYLEIPPNQQEVTITGNCSSGCSSKLPHSIFITSTFLHMHTAGKSGEITLYRNGLPVYTFEAVTGYDYNKTESNALANAVEVKPGDKIYVKCVYSSIGRNYTTVEGEATSDETCQAFLAYYPMITELQFCGQWKTVDVCKASSGAATFNSEYCDVPSFLKILPLTMYACNASCTETTACQVIVNGLNDTECPNNPDVMQHTGNYLSNYLDLYRSCASVVAPPTETPNTTSTGCHDNPDQPRVP